MFDARKKKRLSPKCIYTNTYGICVEPANNHTYVHIVQTSHARLWKCKLRLCTCAHRLGFCRQIPTAILEAQYFASFGYAGTCASDRRVFCVSPACRCRRRHCLRKYDCATVALFGFARLTMRLLVVVQLLLTYSVLYTQEYYIYSVCLCVLYYDLNYKSVVI